MSGPPPLEDMAGSLVNAKNQREAKQAEHDRHTAYVKMMKAANEQPPEGTEAGAKLLTCAADYKSKAEEGDVIRKNGTCGLQKGFLDAAPKKRKPKSKSDDMEVIRPKEKPKPKGHIDGFEMPSIDVTGDQVHDVLNAGSADNWMTPELLQAIMREPDLLVALQDPRMQKMIEEIGKDPKAVDKYRDNKELMKFYQTYIRLMSSFANKPK